MPFVRPTLLLALCLPLTPALARDSLKAFQPVLGKCYAGDVGSGARDTHCFTAMYGGKHVRDTHRIVMQGRVIYRGETVYSIEGGDITFHYVNSLGGIGRGTAQAVPKGLSFGGSMRSDPGAAEQSMDNDWRWRPDGYEVADGRGKPVIYRRVANPAD